MTKEEINKFANLLSLDPPYCWSVFSSLVSELNPAALELLVEVAKSSDCYKRRAAVESIGLRADGYNAAATLRLLLHDKSPLVVRTVLESLGKLKIQSAHDEVVRFLQTEDAATRKIVVKTIGVLWEDEDFERLRLLFKTDCSEDVRKEAAWVLFDHAAENNWKRLFELWCNDLLSRHRGWACKLAGRYGNSSCLAILNKLAQDKDGHVRKAAQIAIHENNVK